MLTALDNWNRELTATGGAPLGIGIGLNYGPAVVGDVGSERSMSFTVIGDTVNTASRLQELTRTLGTALLASDAVIKAAGSHRDDTLARIFERLQDGGQQALRGRNLAVRVWRDPRRLGIVGSGEPMATHTHQAPA